MSDCDFTDETDYTANMVKESLGKVNKLKTAKLTYGRTSMMQVKDEYFICDSPLTKKGRSSVPIRTMLTKSTTKKDSDQPYFNTPTLRQSRISHASF